MATEPLIHWPQPVIEYAGFVGSFLATGAMGFRWAVLPALSSANSGSPAEHRELEGHAMQRAALLGLVGALLGAVLFAMKLPGSAVRHHVTVAQWVTRDADTRLQVALVALGVVGFALALGRVALGWLLATIGVLAGTLSAALFGQWSRLANPIHRLAGGLWIGTLFVLVVAGISTVLGSRLTPERRGAAAAALVHAFSPLALAAAGGLAVSGVITAWLHLKYLAALWTTPYGITLMVKLGVVLGVVGLGAWNWRRQRPRLGSEDAAARLRRSASAELVVAAIVLAITAILVSLPTPRLPGR